MQTRVGTAHWNEPKRYCPKCRAAFFPSSRALGIDKGNYSPEVLKTIVYAGTQLTSFAKEAPRSRRWAVECRDKQVERITEKIGQERVEQRNEAFKRLCVALMDRCKSQWRIPH